MPRNSKKMARITEKFLFGAVVMVVVLGGFSGRSEYSFIFSINEEEIESLERTKDIIISDLREFRFTRTNLIINRSHTEDQSRLSISGSTNADDLDHESRNMFGLPRFSNFTDTLSSIDLLIEDQDREIGSLVERIDEINSRISSLVTENNDRRLMIRALCLGSIGGLCTLLYRNILEIPSNIELELPVSRIYFTMGFSAIVSIVVFGLFKTQQITIFETSDSDVNSLPNYWRVTILCIFSGSFAEPLFNLARQRFEQATQNEGGSPGSAQSQKQSA